MNEILEYFLDYSRTSVKKMKASVNLILPKNKYRKLCDNFDLIVH